ncbi:MAG TPA: hypothetical protein VGE04_09060 [Chloroflexia bacterium]
MLLSGIEVQPLIAVLGVLLDNCSSLLDCWDTLGAAAAAAVGAGAAAVFVGGLLLSPGEGTGIVEPGVTSPLPGPASAPPTVAQAPPQATGPFAPPVPPGFGSTAPTAPAPGPMTGTAIGASPPATPPPPVPAVPAPPTPVAPQTFDAGLAAGLAAGAAPVAAVAGAAAGSRASSSSTGSSTGQDEDLDRCPEVDASLFGLPDINTRHDCGGTRPDMPPGFAGLDFTSNDDHGRRMELPFEPGVTGEVTYVGGSFNSVQVTLENGNRIQFLHASQVLVQLGQQVGPTTVLGRTGGTGPHGPNHYEIHLHVQAFDRHGNLIDPDCALSGEENRRLKRKVLPPEAEPVPASVPTPQTYAAPQPATQPLTQSLPPVPTGITCTRCGNVSPANALFCGWCGQTFVQAAAPAPPPIAPPAPPVVSAPPQTIYCGNCGQVNAWGSVYCGRCGVRLSY